MKKITNQEKAKYLADGFTLAQIDQLEDAINNPQPARSPEEIQQMNIEAKQDAKEFNQLVRKLGFPIQHLTKPYQY